MKDIVKILGIILFMIIETATVIANIFMIYFGVSLITHVPFGSPNFMVCCLMISLFTNFVNSLATIYFINWRYGKSES